jgi:hypothetical protein
MCLSRLHLKKCKMFATLFVNSFSEFQNQKYVQYGVLICLVTYIYNIWYYLFTCWQWESLHCASLQIAQTRENVPSFAKDWFQWWNNLGRRWTFPRRARLMTIPGSRGVSLYEPSLVKLSLYLHMCCLISPAEDSSIIEGVSLYKPPLVKMFLYLYWFWQMSLAKIPALGSFLWKKNERGMAIYLHRMCVPNTVAESRQSF